MTYVNDISYNLKRIKRRAIAFWLTAGTAVVLSLGLFLFEETAAAKPVALGGIILSIATWMSGMLSVCPRCHASFHEGYAPRIYPTFRCAHCRLAMNSDQHSAST